MNFVSNSGIEDGMYGTYKSKKNKDTGETESVFVPLGNAVYVNEVYENIENNSISLFVSFNYMGRKRKKVVPRVDFFCKNKVEALAEVGMDITPHNLNVFLDTIRRQEQTLNKNKVQPKLLYENLGWIYLPIYNNDGMVKGYKPCYRANKLINCPNGEYQGEFSVSTMGSFEKWLELVKQEVLGHIIPEFVLIASLSAVVVGALAMKIPIENPIVHFYFLSGSGKSTMAHLAVSVIGQPFNGDKTLYSPKLNEYTRQKSLLQTWGSTTNAIILSQAGNRGVPTILDELGKFNGKNPRDIIFNFSEGSDKMRASQDLKVRLSEGYNTTFLSFGESSLIEKCKDKLEGLNVRVMEINKPMTESAEHSRRIKNGVKSNNGWAAPKLAEYIINNGGINRVVGNYNDCIARLSEIMPETKFGDRVAEKFYAVFLTTAILAKEALELDFDIEGLVELFKDNEIENAKSRDVSAKSYDEIIQHFNINLSNFYQGNREIPHGSCWGKYIDKPIILSDGRVVIAEYLVRMNIVDKFLEDNGYQNPRACIKTWKEKGYLDYEKGKNYRKRQIIPGQKEKESVYVFRVFADDATKAEILEQESKRLKKEAEKEKRKQSMILSIEKRIKARKDDENNDSSNTTANC